MGLKEYKAKRDFHRTREPEGKSGKARGLPEPFFVVQKHAATRLHYDFRLAMQGVLKSWAVPKGFPTRKGDRRLAVQVEDHPMDYALFEGTIPEHNYGAGTVMVWDYGPYEVVGDDPVHGLDRGKLHLRLNGTKLKGEWVLVRMNRPERQDKPQWLLMKAGDDAEEIPSRKDDQSALTRRSMKQIARDDDAQWQSNRRVQGSSALLRIPKLSRTSLPAAASRAKVPRSNPGAPKAVLGNTRVGKRSAAFVEPMKALLAGELPRGEEWVYEIKFDGVRAVAIKKGSEIQLFSRNAKGLTQKFPELAKALRALPCREAILDGEVVALDSEGRSSFQLLQSLQRPGGKPPPVYYYAFDLIQVDGKDVAGLPLTKRKAALAALIAGMRDPIRLSSGIEANSDRLLREMKARGLEGVMAKRKDSTYEPGRRSGAWVKFKWTNEQEFVIGGYTAPRGSRAHFGAILVGYYERGKLMFASKVGTGFDEQTLEMLHRRFQKLIQANCPFANVPEPARAGGRGLTRAEMRRCTWLGPKLVAQVRFAEWTRDGHLRQPSFVGLREDKRPQQVVRERPGR